MLSLPSLVTPIKNESSTHRDLPLRSNAIIYSHPTKRLGLGFLKISRERERQGRKPFPIMAKEQEKFQLYNTMTKQKETFVPKVPGKVGMYVCGVTAYDFSHLGHARAYVAFDILYRFLKHLGYEVTYVRNFTDVDDKIIRRANELGEDPLSVSNRFCQEFLDDMVDLQCLPPTHEPRVSGHMEQIISLIAKIESKGCAYVVEGDVERDVEGHVNKDVYFSVNSFPNYGRLSGRKLEDNRAGERVAVDQRKKNPADFALWKAVKPGEPSWESPWGRGRPGWHIECSAMSAHYLTYSFDIHGGGLDLTFPHHENELTQSCAACPESNVGFWMHNGLINVNGEKMSKSLGNFVNIREVTNMYHPLALRYFLMGTHYRSTINYTISQIDIASDSVFYIYQSLKDCEDALSLFRERQKEEGTLMKGKTAKTARITPQAQECIRKLRSDFQTKMLDDLHTSSILNVALLEALRLMNTSKKQKQLSVIQSLVELEKEVKEVLSTLGLLSPLTYSEVLQQLRDKALKRAGITEDYLLGLIEERNVARRNKNFARSDEIRKDMDAKGIALMDGENEAAWKPRVPVVEEQPCAPVVQGGQECGSTEHEQRTLPAAST